MILIKLEDLFGDVLQV